MVRYLQIRGDAISSWNDSRIDVSIASLTLSEDSKYKIRIDKDSLYSRISSLKKYN
jgi:hypothetical protein